jgi:hypothetical protein
MKTTHTKLKNGLHLYKLEGREIISNLPIKISGKKNMFQILQSGGEIPTSFVPKKTDRKFFPKNIDEFFEKLSFSKQLNLHFGKMI